MRKRVLEPGLCDCGHGSWRHYGLPDVSHCYDCPCEAWKAPALPARAVRSIAGDLAAVLVAGLMAWLVLWVMFAQWGA